MHSVDNTTLWIGPKDVAPSSADPIAAFAQKAWLSFGTTYRYGGDWMGCRLDLPATAEGRPSKVDIETGQVSALCPDPMDEGVFPFAKRVALAPGGELIAQGDDWKMRAEVLASSGYADCEIVPSSSIARPQQGIKIKLTFAGEQMVWDYLRLFEWPRMGKAVVIEDADGHVVYRCPRAYTNRLKF
jgi:hypothetical protein